MKKTDDELVALPTYKEAASMSGDEINARCAEVLADIMHRDYGTPKKYAGKIGESLSTYRYAWAAVFANHHTLWMATSEGRAYYADCVKGTLTSSDDIADRLFALLEPGFLGCNALLLTRREGLDVDFLLAHILAIQGELENLLRAAMDLRGESAPATGRLN